HRPAQFAPHPRAGLDAGHGSKVADVTAVAHDQPSTNCFFVLRGRKRLPGLCKRSAGGAACSSLTRSFGSTHLGIRQMTFVLSVRVPPAWSWRHRCHKWLPSLRGNFRRINPAKSTIILLE